MQSDGTVIGRAKVFIMIIIVFPQIYQSTDIICDGLIGGSFITHIIYKT